MQWFRAWSGVSVPSMPQRRRRPRGHIRELPSGSFQAIVYAGRDPLTGQGAVRAGDREDLPGRRGRAHQVAEPGRRGSAPEVRPDRPAGDRAVARGRRTGGHHAGPVRRPHPDLHRSDPRHDARRRSSTPRCWSAVRPAPACRSACDGRRRSGHACRPLSSSTVRKIHFILSAALGRAVRWSQLAVNRAQLAEPPSPAATEPDPPTAAEAARCWARLGHRPGLGPAAVADDGDRLPSRRGQRTALASRRPRPGVC